MRPATTANDGSSFQTASVPNLVVNEADEEATLTIIGTMANSNVVPNRRVSRQRRSKAPWKTSTKQSKYSADMGRPML